MPPEKDFQQPTPAAEDWVTPAIAFRDARLARLRAHIEAAHRFMLVGQSSRAMEELVDAIKAC